MVGSSSGSCRGMVKTGLGEAPETCLAPAAALSGWHGRSSAPHGNRFRATWQHSILDRFLRISPSGAGARTWWSRSSTASPASALSVVGLAVLSWWLMALAKGAEVYEKFERRRPADRPDRPDRADLGLLPASPLGIRHLVTDAGAGFELGINKTSRSLTIVGSLLLTAALWFWLLGSFNEHRRKLHPVGKVRGLGSAHEGGEHWLTERVTSLALLLLGPGSWPRFCSCPSSTSAPWSSGSHARAAAVPMTLFVDHRFQSCARGD